MNASSLHRLSAFVDLTKQEREAMRDLLGPEVSVDATDVLRSEGDRNGCFYFLHEGWMLSSIAHADGGRQVVKVHRSGDVLGAPSLPFDVAAESLVALTAAKVSAIPLAKVGKLFVSHPRLAALLYLASQEERVILMDRLAVGGQLGAKENLAALLLLMFDGRPPENDADTKLQIPLTQSQIADVLGLSPVHVNRMMHALEDDGLIRRYGRANRNYVLPDVPRLRRLVGMPERVRQRHPAWLPPPTV